MGPGHVPEYAPQRRGPAWIERGQLVVFTPELPIQTSLISAAIQVGKDFINRVNKR
jgi:hypothetical protein